MTRLLYIHALSPLHAGTGQSIGAIDLAIARDRSSGFPYLPGSSLKGSLRARARVQAEEKKLSLDPVYHVFGPETANASDHAGALLMGDANLLLLPVRSVAGTFAWVTSPFLLHRYARDCSEAGIAPLPVEVPTVRDIGRAFVVAKTRVAGGNGAPQSRTTLLVGQRVIFEDLDFRVDDAGHSEVVTGWAEHLGRQIFPAEPIWREMLMKRLCVVHDDAMAFLSEQATDVVTRVAIDHDTKTAKPGQLWTEENLPVESILVSLVSAMGNGKIAPSASLDKLGELCKTPLQLGGKATVGRGRCRLTLTPPGGKR